MKFVQKILYHFTDEKGRHCASFNSFHNMDGNLKDLKWIYPAMEILSIKGIHCTVILNDDKKINPKAFV